MTLTLSQPDPTSDPSVSEPNAVTDFGTIRLHGHVSTVAAEDLRNQLIMAADHSGTTAIDASEVVSIGQAALQLLIAAKREATERDHDLHYTGASAAFRERVDACQLADAIGFETGKDDSL
ncbi:MAG: STAS domain-containing protein [Pseudomonadota bacterium]|jgi:anti-anti-sigma regulatory factor|uniref:STAS domain-containing protein n=1 Tax=Sphingobium sp. CECT 9361 TaxID=2845384 RepID=UPI001E3E016F|nr:STAS domain-containing protein [Sphingobium sp. CECT 9361]CAH0356129.1 hypothetical protein SPH9361_03899 [Sphingobium sp. CECT 9361]